MSVQPLEAFLWRHRRQLAELLPEPGRLGLLALWWDAESNYAQWINYPQLVNSWSIDPSHAPQLEQAINCIESCSREDVALLVRSPSRLQLLKLERQALAP